MIKLQGLLSGFLFKGFTSLQVKNMYGVYHLSSANSAEEMLSELAKEYLEYRVVEIHEPGDAFDFGRIIIKEPGISDDVENAIQSLQSNARNGLSWICYDGEEEEELADLQGVDDAGDIIRDAILN